MSTRRNTDSVYLQHIWNAILDNDSSRCTFPSLLSSIQSRYDPKCSAAKLHNEIRNAIQDGCVQEHDGLYSMVEGFEIIRKDRNDWYCFECHGPGLVVPCPTCFRVFHTDCLSTASETHWSCRLPLEDSTMGTDAKPDSEFPPKHPCPVCKRISRARTPDNITSLEDLQRIFTTALAGIRHRVSWKTMQQVGYLYEPARNEYLVYEQINTRMIGDRLRAEPRSKGGYFNRTNFLVDLDNLVHNTAVFYGSKHAISNMARQTRSHMKRAMRESAYCIDCYLRSSTGSASSRFTAACRKPHRLLWFQHNGWSFRPCKMLYENAEGYEVICFGGRHEREFVLRSRAFDMTFTAPELGLRMTPSLKKALDEAEEYKANQSAYDRSLPVPFSTTASTSIVSSTIKEPGISCSSFKSSESGTKRGRKRKAGPKYSSAFGSTDTESSQSVLSSVATSSSCKRRKLASSICEPDSGQTADAVNRNGRLSINFNKRFTDNSLSSLSSQSECSDDESADLHFSTRLSACKNARGLKDSCLGVYRKHPDNLREGRYENDNSNHSNGSSCSAANTRPVIRIKPLPPPKHDDQDSSLPTSACSNQTYESNLISTVQSKSGPSTSSSSSCPSSGSATIPGILSLDDPVSGDSVHSFSSASSKQHHVRQGGRPPKRRSKTQIQKLKADRSSDDERAPDVKQITTRITCNNSATSKLKETEHSLKATITTSRSSRTVRSPSPLSSLSDCDSDSSSSSSSLQSHSCTPSPTSSSLSSSSSVSSASTIPRSSCYSTNAKTNRNSGEACVPNGSVTSTCTMSDKCGFPSRQVAKSVKNKSELPSAMFSSCSLYSSASEHSLSPTKPRNTSRFHVEASSINSSFSRERHNSKGFLNNQPDRATKSSKRKSHNNLNKISESSSISPRQIALSVASGSAQPSHQFGITTSVNGFAKSNNGTSWSSLTRVSAAYGNHTPMTHMAVTNSASNPNSTGPTPPASNSASSSCYSSVSPAALSTTSGLGSSLSDPKSVDASPGEVAAILGSTSFSCSSVGPTAIQPIPIQSDTASYKSAEEHIHRIYADKLAMLITERDQAREEVVRRDTLIAKLRREHEAEIKRVKQMTWCQVCLNEAFYHCCPGTAYCSEPCQLRHWTEQHNRDCRRRGESQQQQQRR